jgi:hypothetical protein
MKLLRPIEIRTGNARSRREAARITPITSYSCVFQECIFSRTVP